MNTAAKHSSFNQVEDCNACKVTYGALSSLTDLFSIVHTHPSPPKSVVEAQKEAEECLSELHDLCVAHGAAALAEARARGIDRFSGEQLVFAVRLKFGQLDAIAKFVATFASAFGSDRKSLADVVELELERFRKRNEQ